MSHIHSYSRKLLLPGVLVMALACLSLAACGSSSNSSSSTSTTNAANTSSTATGGGRPGPAGGHVGINSPALRAALTAFAACLRQNGIALPNPNTSGTGPVFNTKGINTSSAQFTAARLKCQSKLRGAFARPGGAARAGRGGASTGGGA